MPIEFVATRQTIEELHRYAETVSQSDFERLLVVATCALENYLRRRNSWSLFRPELARYLMSRQNADLHEWLDIVDNR